jgi:hypothetical protein
MPLPKRTIEELTAGAEALAKYQGAVPDHQLLAKFHDIAERHAALQRWEREGVLKVHNRLEFLEVEPGQPSKTRLCVQHEIRATGEVIEEEPLTIAHGGYPSELLLAKIALALHACAGKEIGNG